MAYFPESNWPEVSHSVSSDNASTSSNANDGEVQKVGDVFKKRISKIYKRLKETDSNLKAMEKLMSNQRFKENSSRQSLTDQDNQRPLTYHRLTQSMQDLYTNLRQEVPQTSNAHPSHLTSDNVQRTESENLMQKIANLETQQAQLQNSIEMLNKTFSTANIPNEISGEHFRSSLEQLARQLNQVSLEQGNSKCSYSDREKELKLKAKKSISCWKNRCESLYLDKQHLEDQLVKFRDHNQVLLREQDNLRSQLEEIHQKMRNDAHLADNLQLQLSRSKDESFRKDDIMQRFQTSFNETQDEVTLLKAELNKLEKANKTLQDDKTNLTEVNQSLEQKLKAMESRIQKDNALEAEIIKKLENENQKLKDIIFELKQNDGKMSTSIESTRECHQIQVQNLKEENGSLLLKSEKLTGEIECLKCEFGELKDKYERVLKDYYSKSEECVSRAKSDVYKVARLEESLKDSYNTINYKNQEFRVMLAGVSLEIDKLLNLWNSISGYSVPIQGILGPATPTSSHSKIHLVDIQSKLKLFQEELSSWRNLSSTPKQHPKLPSSPKYDVMKQNVFGVAHSTPQHNSNLNISHRKSRKKVNSTKIPSRDLRTSREENGSSQVFLPNSSLSLSSINKSPESSEEPSMP